MMKLLQQMHPCMAISFVNFPYTQGITDTLFFQPTVMVSKTYFQVSFCSLHVNMIQLLL